MVETINNKNSLFGHFKIEKEKKPLKKKLIRPAVEALRRHGVLSHVFIVIGLPGERIRFNNGQVLINDVALNEPYARPCNERDFCSFPLTIIVPPGQYYMLGDNRSFSNDSRVWGPVPKSNLVGEVIGKYWPGIGGLR